MRVTFIRREPIAKNIFSFYFKPDKMPKYTAGQFIELYIPHPNKDKRGDKHWFTLSSSPHEDLLAITTKFMPAGEIGSTFKKALKRLEEGTELYMASPMGDFVLPKDPSIPLIFVAGGIGCTPFRSIITDLQITGEKRDIFLILAANKLEDVAFRPTFEMLGNNFQIVLREKDPSGKHRTGRLSGEMIQSIATPSPEHYVYLSGPEPMVEALEKDLKSAGLNKRHIFTDFFPGYLPI